MGLLSRDEILARPKRGPLLFPVPEWGGDVLIRVMSARERDEFEEETSQREESKKLVNFRARLVAKALVNDQGQPLFTERDIEALGELDGSPVDAVFKAAIEHNGMSKKAVDKLEKNSETTTAG